MKPSYKKRSKKLRKTQKKRKMRGGDDLKSAGIAAISSVIYFKSIEEQIFDYVKGHGGNVTFRTPGTHIPYIFTISDDGREVHVANKSEPDVKASIYMTRYGHS